jgi:hypothetical protein
VDTTDFPPPRQQGFTFHASLIAVVVAAVGVLAYLIYRKPIGLLPTLFMVIGALGLVLLPILAYRLYALWRANYSLDRNRLTLKWGLRVEQIPIAEIEWVRPMAAIVGPIPLPFFRLPGSVVGIRHHSDLGEIEYLASNSKSLLLVATPRKTFAISPEDTRNFLQDVQRAIEMGSLSPVASQSVYPSFVVAQAWNSSMARFLWLAGLFLNIGLLAWVGLMAPSLINVSMGFLPSGEPRPPSPGLWLVLLPIVSIVFYLVGWVTGLVIYRRQDHQPMAFIIWASSVITAFLFLLSVLFILTTPV